MQNLFDEVASLDKRCYEKFLLSEDILMENASNGMAKYILKHFKKGSKIIVVCGSGNNGADGITLARILHVDYDVSILHVKEPKSKMAILQKQRADAIGVSTCDTISTCDVIVEAIVGTGFNGVFEKSIEGIIDNINSSKSFKIACDIPSIGFMADVTLTMGGLKKELFLDDKKDFVGDIEVINLGISRDVYETDSNVKLLEMKDLELPLRTKQDSHKGSFGHLVVICGQKSGACTLSALAGFKMGAGLVSLVGKTQPQNMPNMLMFEQTLPKNTTAIALGMGLGKCEDLSKYILDDVALLLDADMFHNENIVDLLKWKNLVVTPHPKEFVELLKITNIADINIQTLQKNRFLYVEMFCKKFPHVVLLLKGANVIIGRDEKFFVNSYGSSVLAKGGSGDVLSGIISSLMAQGYEPLKATINGSLIHTKLARLYKGADFSLTPEDLVAQIGNL